MVSISTNLVAGVNKPGTSYLVFLGCGVLGLSVSSLFFFFIPIISLSVCIIISFYGALISYWAILEYMPEFIKRNMCGKDQCKVSFPEPIGIIPAVVYLLIIFVLIPVCFLEWVLNHSEFPHDKFFAFISLAFGICSAVLLGFADDMFDLRWRHKLMFPALASLPVLLVYHVTGASTVIVVPNQLQTILPFGRALDIGVLYYVYMGMMVIFCTNAINILSGINGLEAGQALVVALSIVVFNIVQLLRLENEKWEHSLSLYFMVPFMAVDSVLLHFNWYPAKGFVGDTFCYWAGMTFGATSVIGHFSKTMLLFLIPQIFNFLYSLPQLFHLIPCPRHRLPKYDPETNTVGMSYSTFMLHISKTSWIRVNNFTILNLLLKILGPMHEETLTKNLLVIQFFFSCVAFFVRFFIADLLYDVVY
ncbi:unnamed protein product [Enterobius vermicularis]|uniref:UDP-N-acetylglucosamine--dolichyl-phosphate N-acetylglucosaminephosphotransferase n=1 Tax=Enterobius vermicularis TaxID=51028 RepID=A0A0N4VDN4_ENTVE|nr:unnamed protein product [Enterobius vermicularis]